MAELMSETALAPITESTPDNRGYAITIRRFGPDGKPSLLTVRIPENATLASIRDNPLLLAATLKDGDPVWSQYEAGFVLVAVLHANSLGLDIIQGDIYPVEGRLGVSDWAKIKYARARGYRAVVEMIAGETISIPWETKREKGVWNGSNYRCTVKVIDAGGNPINEYTTELKQWFGNSTEWRNRPAESLRRKTLARAYQEVCPVGVDPDEAPPLEPAAPTVLQR